MLACPAVQVVIDTSRVRRIGTNNRVIAGLLLFNQRGLPSPCSNSRFAAIAGSCKGGAPGAVELGALGGPDE